MSLTSPGSPDSEVATLGRQVWAHLHKSADALPDTAGDLSRFTQLVRLSVAEYPCHTCRDKAWRTCGAVLSHPRLWVRRRRLGLPTRVVARAWVARIHACITAHLLDDGRGYVSEKSRALAAAVAQTDGDRTLSAAQKDEALASLF